MAGSWIKDNYSGRGFLLLKQKDGITEFEQVPCSKTCEVQEIQEYGRRLFELYGNKYQWIKVYDKEMKLLEIIQ